MITVSKAKSILALGLMSALFGAQWVSAQPAHERDRDRQPPHHQTKPAHKPDANQHHGNKPPAHKPPQHHKPPTNHAKPPAHKPPQHHKPPANHAKPPVHKPPHHAQGPQHRPPVHKPPQQHRPPQHRPPQHRPPEYRPLPHDFREVRNQAYRNRQYIGRGPLPPKGYQVVRGKRLFGNIGQPLTWQQQQYLPYYRGHEWRRLGGDLLLVDSSSGVVIELFKDVL